MKYILVTLSMLFLVACSNEPPKLLKTEQLEVKVIDVNPPKHYRLTVSSKYGSHELSGSKHCSNWNNVEVGDKFILTYNTVQYRDKVYTEFPVSSCQLANDFAKYKVGT